MALRATLVILSCLVLAAHFLRSGGMLPTLLSLAIPFLLLIRKSWVLIVVQLFTYFGALLWIYTAINLLMQRMESGAPWGRMVAILGAVAAVTALSGLLLNTQSVRKRYKGE